MSVRAARRSVRSLSPTRVDQILGRALAAQQQGQVATALALYRLVLTGHPAHPRALYYAGLCAHQLGETARAVEFVTASLRHAPDHADGWVALGKLHEQIGNGEAARDCYMAALAQDPEHIPALHCAGSALLADGDLTSARQCWSRALTQTPGSAEAVYNRAYLKLLQGDLAGGFADYESRWLCPSFFVSYGRRDVAAVPMWTGQDVAGKTLYVHAEQGFGDVIQMLRYIPVLRRMGARVVLEVQPALERLAAASFADDEGVTVVTRAEERLTPEAIHYHVPTMSLPLRCGVDPIPPTPYLKPEVESAWLRRPGELRVGIVWAGSPTHPNDHNRSCPVESLAPLWEVPGVLWHSLQVGPRADEAKGTPCLGSFPVQDFADTAQILRTLDLVIAVDTSTAHLAGALGVPVWILLPACPDWRWQLEREDSPWYPSARLFRRAPGEDWPALMARVADALRVRVGA